jgi:hypothetical protein
MCETVKASVEKRIWTDGPRLETTQMRMLSCLAGCVSLDGNIAEAREARLVIRFKRPKNGQTM